MAPKSKKPVPKPQPKTTTPNWPPLRPLLPAADLTLTPPPHRPNLPNPQLPPRHPKDEALRVNDRFQIDDARFAEMLWSTTALKELVTTRFEEDEYGYSQPAEEDDNALAERARQLWGGEPLGLNPNIRIYRYSAGQFFGQHYDDANNITLPPPNSRSKATPARTTWTLLVYLTSCTGGETIFYPEATRANRNPGPIAVAPEVGMALLHRHGDHCMIHEGAEVTGGEKWVLRSDLVVPR
ncbi:uncharacterized protein N7487_002563 [Penicillium crustosum]|uniref:uncharacterized protein n=1 Tax=Penicillium crustosum TaxID=36656 RepID=UPI002394B354|nr:uncharacterized protein N7487_002563 [Penicillium crustosum]KAJ5419013.1 hypothetical protein N7487_002563 [Penicillium crustosum]